MSTVSSGKITVLLADDHPATRAGIRALLAQADDIEIVGEAQSGFEVYDLVQKLRPKILLLDLIMPGLRPAELEKQVRENHPETITLILTTHDRDAYLVSMMDAGVAGYLNKKESKEGLINAIRQAAQGEILFDKEQFVRAKQWREEVGVKINQLTPREKEILEMLAKGLDNDTIAKSLKDFFIKHLLQKTGLVEWSISTNRAWKYTIYHQQMQKA
jgi:DNA-binding NarL/FixJ family response regulator